MKKKIHLRRNIHAMLENVNSTKNFSTFIFWQKVNYHVIFYRKFIKASQNIKENTNEKLRI